MSLSCLLQKPFKIYDIRRGRRKPGLMPQHLACVRAAKLISNAHVTGDIIGSAELFFSPGKIKSGDYLFDIGTAGSTSLVLQTIIPAVLLSKVEKTTITLIGGTHVPFSPCFHYLANVFSPMLKLIGIDLTLSIVSCRQKDGFFRKLRAFMTDSICPVDFEIMNVSTPGQGTFCFLHAESAESLAGFTTLGARGKKAELVGQEAAEEFRDYYFTGSALDPHLSDQIILYLAMCGEESVFSTSRITEHLLTNLRVIGLFHKYSYEVRGEPGKPGTVRINPSSNNKKDIYME
ncbi:MAG: hypothetical protein AMK74_06935 [Nitrospira bacterium SM23_35]|nr:MAG: hypothetical protein AMK74_06935 [Nitrospira bacterium SM23_35]